MKQDLLDMEFDRFLLTVDIDCMVVAFTPDSKAIVPSMCKTDKRDSIRLVSALLQQLESLLL